MLLSVFVRLELPIRRWRLAPSLTIRECLRATDDHASDKGHRDGAAVSGKNSEVTAILSKRSYPPLPKMTVRLNGHMKKVTDRLLEPLARSLSPRPASA